MPKLSEQLFWEMKRIDGSRFMGHLAASTGVSSKDKALYRLLYIRKPTFIRVGDVIKAYNDEVVILMDNPNDLYWAVTFKAAYAKQILEWRRPVTAVHPVAHVAMNSVYIDMGPLYVNMDSPEELNIGGLVDTKYHFLTGQDVHPEDKVGDFIVRRVVKVMGVNLVYTA